MTDTDTATLPVTAAEDTAGGSSEAKTGAAPALPQFALNAVNTQVARVSDVLTGAAKAIDELVSGVDSSLPEPVKSFATSASTRLRGLADRANEDEAAKLLQALQRGASEHPLATAGIGAAIGTAIGVAISRLGRGNA